ncbi:DUF4231 domain-containing protein [Streptomyces sp. NPDC007084]|uniref:DUF4231 domain-containing protein n=1 Tax=Streptomyces sp. NPDC007084 TaxID=3154313 RepID=UPI003455D10A
MRAAPLSVHGGRPTEAGHPQRALIRYPLHTLGVKVITTDLLDAETRIIKTEARLHKERFYRRIARIALVVVPLITVGAMVAVNLLIDFPSFKSRRDSALIPGGLFFIVSMVATIGSAKWATESFADDLTHLKILETERRAHLGVTGALNNPSQGSAHEYREDVPVIRDDYRRSAERYRNRHNWFQLTVIVGSILTSVCTTASAEQGVWSLLAVVLSALVSISAGIISYFKFRERSLNLQQTADAIDLEIQAYKLGIRRYKKLAPDEAFADFAEEVERIREEQRKKELQLEQPPEAANPSRPQAPSGP